MCVDKGRTMSAPSDRPVVSVVRETVTRTRTHEFDQYLDEAYGFFEIEGCNVRASDALWTDRDAYEDARLRWLENKRQRLDEQVCTRFPYPIAACYRDFLRGAESSDQRWGFLRDTWEAAISLMMAMVLGEFRASGQVLEDLKIKRNWLHSQTIRERIEVLRLCRAFGEGDFVTTSALQDTAVEQMVELNQLRNDVAHRGTLTEQQADEMVREGEPILVDLLSSLELLVEIPLLRPRRGKYELFMGCESRLNIQPRKLSKRQRRALAEHESRTFEVFAVQDERDLLFSLSPYIICPPDSNGRHCELAYFKKKVPGRLEGLHYEVFGASRTFEMSDASLRQDLEDVKGMFVNSGRKEKAS